MSTPGPLADAAAAGDFYERSHLSRLFKKGCGMTPWLFLNQYRSAQALALAWIPADNWPWQT